METTTKFTIVLGTRSYTFAVPDGDFLASINNDINKLKNENGSIENTAFISHYLNVSYLKFKLDLEYEKLKKENNSLKNELNKLEKELLEILDKFKEN
ncbi:hypothetical protein [Campylobacter sp. MG1]|uniref:hypothetical protein n=1 Tax=Campylobacter sp. MG1 TaxID=2976332 RepID=UPI00226C9A69|nr:hypothetical protein [Campylobacter sp. MG1]